MTASAKNCAGWIGAVQAGSGLTTSQSRFEESKPSKASRLTLTTVPPSKARLKLPFATSSTPPPAFAIPVGKKSRVGCGPFGPNGGGSSSGGLVLQPSSSAAATIALFFMRAAFLGPLARGVKTISRPADGRSRREEQKARAMRGAEQAGYRAARRLDP